MHNRGVDKVAVGALTTPVGRLSVAVSEVGLLGVRWGEPARRPGVAVVDRAEWTAPVLEQLDAYFRGERRTIEVPLDWRFTTGVTAAVLRTLYETVPFGEVITYGELAARSDTSAPARAVGTMMARNQIPIVVPCHRVIAGDGLGGYSGGSGVDGLEVKRWLLTMEGALPPTLDWDPRGLAAVR